jgi:hypothetical protein
LWINLTAVAVLIAAYLVLAHLFGCLDFLLWRLNL